MEKNNIKKELEIFAQKKGLKIEDAVQLLFDEGVSRLLSKQNNKKLFFKKGVTRPILKRRVTTTMVEEEYEVAR